MNYFYRNYVQCLFNLNDLDQRLLTLLPYSVYIYEIKHYEVISMANNVDRKVKSNQ